MGVGLPLAEQSYVTSSPSLVRLFGGGPVSQYGAAKNLIFNSFY